MEYKKFKELLKKGECKNIDYKIECNAFLKGKDEAKAELVKDIIAFANNGNSTSYLVIGVANDCNGFKSVENDKLTDDNVQNLCKENIFPIPKVKLINCCWSKVSDERHRDKKFVIIQVGPQVRQCFRFNRDCINYEKKYCFKKNEVWIRREATSDLAIPEESKRLLEGKEAITEALMDDNTDYKRLSKSDYKCAITKDLYNFMDSIDGGIEEEKTQFGKKYNHLVWKVLTININKQKLKIVVIIKDKCNQKDLITDICREIPLFHHGILILSVGNVTPSSVESSHLKIKESWGWFCTNFKTKVGEIIRYVAKNQDDFEINNNETFCLALERVCTTQDLYSKLQRAIGDITEQQDIQRHVQIIYNTINRRLNDWKINDCIISTNRTLSDYYLKKLSDGESIKALKENEFIDLNKYGNVIMKRNLYMCEAIDRFIG